MTADVDVLELARSEADRIAEAYPSLRVPCDRYVQAVRREIGLRAAWDAAGRPMTTTSDRSREFAHPLLAEIRSAEAHAARLGEAIGLRAPGRDVGRPQTVVAPRQAGEPPKLVPLADARKRKAAKS